MNHKMTAVLYIVMFYVSFMGPFVLRKAIDPHLPARRLHCHCYHNCEGEAFVAAIMVIGWSIGMMVQCGGLIATGVAASIAMGFAGIVFFALLIVICIVVMGFILFKKRSSRLLTQGNDPNELTVEMRKKIVDKTNRYLERFEKENNTAEKMAEAMHLSKWEEVRKKYLRKYGIGGPQAQKKAMNRDLFLSSIKRLFLEEILDVEKMEEEVRLKELNANNKRQRWIVAQKTRHQYFKKRFLSAIRLIIPEKYRQMKESTDFAAIYSKNEAVLKPQLEVLKKRGSSEEEKKKANEIIKGVVEKENSEENLRARSAAVQNEMVEHFFQAGIPYQTQRTATFRALSRAQMALVLKLEKIYLVKYSTDNPISDEVKGQVKDAISKIEDSMDLLTTGADLQVNQ